MPPGKSKKIIRATLAVFGLAGILGVLGLVERTSQAPTAADAGIDAKLAADFFGAGGTGGGAPAFSGDLNSFVNSQFGPDALSSLAPSEQATLGSLFSAGQSLPSDPARALQALQNTPGPGGASTTRSFFNAIAGSVFDTLRALTRGIPGPIGDRLRAMVGRMADSFGVGGGGGGGGTS